MTTSPAKLDCKIFLTIASDDLEASKLLYENELYPHAVFFLEQSVEKTCKYLLINQQIIPPDQLMHKVRHNSVSVFKIFTTYLVEKLSTIIDTKKIEEDPDDKLLNEILSPVEFLNELKSGINSIEKSSKGRFAEINEFELNKYFEMLEYFTGNTVISSKYNLFFNSDPELVAKWLSKFHLIDEASKVSLDLTLKDDKAKNEFLKSFQKSILDINEFMRIEQVLMVLAQIFSCHSERTRYPENNLIGDPKSRYSISNNLVKRLKEFYPFQEKVINHFKNN
jgi:hypothetical protein